MAPLRNRIAVSPLTECTSVHTIDGYEWSPGKAAQNVWKHGVDFAEATTVLADECCITVEDEDADERRFVTVGASATGQILVVAYT